jgi:hypothetical protein
MVIPRPSDAARPSRSGAGARGRRGHEPLIAASLAPRDQVGDRRLGQWQEPAGAVRIADDPRQRRRDDRLLAEADALPAREAAIPTVDRAASLRQ